MSFIDDGIARRKERESRAVLIAEHGPKIFDDLWGRMNGYITEAGQKGFQLFTNGSLSDRLVELQHPPKTGEIASYRESFKLRLEPKAKQIVAVSRGGPEYSFDLDVCPDGVVCLKWKSERISTEDVAILILKQFLFKDL